MIKFTCSLASGYLSSYTKVIVRLVSKEPKYQACVFPFPITLSDTKVLILFKEVQCPRAPLIVTYREQYIEMEHSFMIFKSIYSSYSALMVYLLDYFCSLLFLKNICFTSEKYFRERLLKDSV